MTCNNNLISLDSLFKFTDLACYNNDYIATIRRREEKRELFHHRSPNLLFRGDLVQYITQICTERQLAQCTLHLAIYMLDLFMDNHMVANDKLYLVANVSLWLASKTEETTGRILKLDDLNDFSKYPKRDYWALEIVVLKFFNFNLMYPTSAHYVHYFLIGAIDTKDLRIVNHSRQTVMDMMNITIRKYLNKILKDVHYMQMIPPSILAAAIISIARQSIELTTWSHQLQEFSGLSETDVEETRLLLIEENPVFSTCWKCASNAKSSPTTKTL